ncbi:MAG: methyltransferase domain-containing protein [Anaerolineae bacterium]|uniref:class I SAM-dependent methyltransferase n=1 Tax=Thermoflexus sp. TaxID=1969742 RepID=UPI0025CEC886|nr:class I SAM-dependent methyltransferase [Thermoflexus sp.]MCS7350917.1 class I SAM-dependent methyltransferase [Thermoflexus sp.]MDW8180368.1 methyltransferase domain-containing protein [Anaerolineae bacterium]
MSQPSVAVFERYATDYDAWYETPIGRGAYRSEVRALAPLLAECPRPWLEIGVGSGRFAQALAVEFGVDPAPTPLRMAAGRGVHTVQAVGERLPFRDRSFGGVLLVATLCFVEDPLAVLREAYRILRPEGGLVLGEIPAESPWGAEYQEKGRQGDPFFSMARFYDRQELEALLRKAGFEIVAYRSTLFQPPDAPAIEEEEPRPGFHPEAGFVGLLARPAASESRS